MTAVTEAQAAYLEMRGDGQDPTVAASILGVTSQQATAWERTEAARRARLIGAAEHTANRLATAVNREDWQDIDTILIPLDHERLYALAIVLAKRLAPTRTCTVCGKDKPEAEFFGDRKPGAERTRCRACDAETRKRTAAARQANAVGSRSP